MTNWNCPTLARDREEAQRIADALATLEREWASLENRGDLRSDLRREQLRALMPPLYPRRDAVEKRIAAGTERQTIVNAAWPLHDAEVAQQRVIAQGFTNSVTAPSPEAVRMLAARVRGLNAFRRHLHAVTGHQSFADEIDVLLDVQRTWDEQAAARRRHFTHTLAPGMRHLSMPPQPWDSLIARLLELRARKEDLTHVR